MTQNLQDLFHEVVDLTPEERADFYATHAVDPQVEKEIETLLVFDAGATEFIQKGIAPAAQEALQNLEAKGRCGAYYLGELIGRGGMGSVFLAERADGEVRQRVAVKLLRPGGDDPLLRQQFLKERQILATLSHPNIARLLDAGHREDGQPFLAMEYVDGKPIDVFAANFSIRRKVALFLKVCGAVAYLHRNLIVHRDLKPNNILVAADGEPKLLDFGIAKILDVTTDPTVTAFRMLTPDYASPEQVVGGTVSTATDVYSLGAVLYLLLTGKTPHEIEHDSPEAITNAICIREVSRPSRWVPTLKGDLDAILMKALRKEPAERYATVDQFAEDLENFLHSRPIRVRGDDFMYRTRKFVRRFWMPVAAMGLALFGLTAGLLVASHERNLAQRRFQEVRRIANELVDIDQQVRDLPGGIKARQTIVETALRYLERLGREANDDPVLCTEIASAYDKVAEVQGVPGLTTHMGRTRDALASLVKAETYLGKALAQRPADPVVLRTAIQHYIYQVRLHEEMRDRKECKLMLDRAKDLLYRLQSLGDNTLEDQQSAGLVWWTSAHFNVNWGNHAQARKDGRLAEASLRKVALARDTPEDWSALGSTLGSYANASRFLGDLPDGLRAIRESRNIIERQVAAYPNNTSLKLRLSTAWWREGCILGELDGPSLGDTDGAIQALTRAMAISDEVAAQDPQDTVSRMYVAMDAWKLGGLLPVRDPARALAVYDQALARLEETPPGRSAREPDMIHLLARSTYPLRKAGRYNEVTRRLDKCYRLLKDIKAYPSPKIDPNRPAEITLRAHADNEAALGRTGHAVDLYEEILQKMDTFGAKPLESIDNAVHYSLAYDGLTRIHRETGNRKAAESIREKRLALWQHWDRKLPGNPFVQRMLAAR